MTVEQQIEFLRAEVRRLKGEEDSRRPTTREGEEVQCSRRPTTREYLKDLAEGHFRKAQNIEALLKALPAELPEAADHALFTLLSY